MKEGKVYMISGKTFQVRKTIAWQIEKTEDFVYIYNNANGQYYILEKIGKEIWLRLCEAVSFEDIVRGISDKYSVDMSIVEEDVRELVNNLLSEHILTMKE